MGCIILVTGGCRSGKSTMARRIAESHPEPKVYLATAPIIDEEMSRRVARHRAERAGSGWQTIEESLDISGVLCRTDPNQTVLIDCLTLWINNLMYEADKTGTDVTEDDMVLKSRELVAACRRRPGRALLVTNEVGLGIVPDNPASRRFRDLVGRCNQCLADAADGVLFMVSGLPLYLKGTPS